MIKRVLVLSVIFSLIFSYNIEAAYLKNQDELMIDNQTEICSNYEYKLYDEGNSEYKSIKIYNSNNYFLEEYETNLENTTIVIPNEIDDVKVEIYKEDGTLDEQLEYKVNDCGYEKIKDPYEVTPLKSIIKINNKNVSFDYAQDLESYSLYYRTNEDIKPKQVDKNTTIKIEQYPILIQLKEQYTEGDQIIDTYYEVKIESKNTYNIRQVSSLDVSTIEAPPISSIYYLMLGVFIVVFLFFRRKEKKYRKKRKRLLQKRRRAIKNKKKHRK